MSQLVDTREIAEQVQVLSDASKVLRDTDLEMTLSELKTRLIDMQIGIGNLLMEIASGLDNINEYEKSISKARCMETYYG